MADHVLEIEFTGDWSKLQSQADRESQKVQQKVGKVAVGGSTGGPPGVDQQANAAANAALDRLGTRTAHERATRGTRVTYSEGFSDAAWRTNDEAKERLTRAEEREMRQKERHEWARSRESRAQAKFEGRDDGEPPGPPIDPSTTLGAGLRDSRRSRGGLGGGLGGRGAMTIFGFRAGALGNYITAGFAAREAWRVAGAELEFGSDMTLAGNDQLAQLKAIQKRNEAVSFGGEIGATAADVAQSAFYGRDVSRLGTTLVERSAQQTDARTQLIFQNRLRLAGARTSADLAAAPNDFDRARLQASFDTTVSQGEIRERRRIQSGVVDAEVATRRAELDISFNERARQREKEEVGSGRVREFDSHSAQKVWQEEIRSQLRQRDVAELATLKTDRAGTADVQERTESEASERLARFRNLNVDRAERAHDIRLRGAITSNLLSGQNDQFGAQLNAMLTETSANVVQAEADPVRARKVFIEGYTKTFSFLAQTGRDLREATTDAETKIRQNTALMGGDERAAFKIGAESARDKALRSLPNNFIFNKLLGGDALRKAITGETESTQKLYDHGFFAEQQARTESLATDEEVARLQSSRKPLTAMAQNIGRSALDRARYLERLGGAKNLEERQHVLQMAMYQNKSLENEIAYGGGAQVVLPGTTGTREASLTDRGNEDAQRALEDIKIANEKMQRLMETSPMFDAALFSGY